MTTCRAPACRATAAAMMPIGPAPVINTSSPSTGNARAVCTALPNGSKIAATSRSISCRCTHTLLSGSTTYSANAPSVSTPRPTVRMHRWRRPAMQLRHVPHTRCPSPLATSPGLTPVTPSPTAATSPTNSWPSVRGGVMAPAAHESHASMCRSVPQIPVRSTRIRTCPVPAVGVGTSVSSSPGCAPVLTSALMCALSCRLILQSISIIWPSLCRFTAQSCDTVTVIDPRRLRVLRALADHGTVTSAARALYLSPSAVSQQLAALEAEAGQSLLERRGRAVRLTAAGHVLATHASLIAAQLERAEADLAACSAGTVGEVTIAAFATAITEVVAPAVASLRGTAPLLRVRVRDAEGNASVPLLL